MHDRGWLEEATFDGAGTCWWQQHVDVVTIRVGAPRLASRAVDQHGGTNWREVGDQLSVSVRLTGDLFAELGLVNRQRLDASQLLQEHGHRLDLAQAPFGLVDMRVAGMYEKRSEERRGGKECVRTCRSRWLRDD